MSGGHGRDAHGHDAHGHGAHPEGDDEAHGGGHGADPNAGVVVGTPPTPAWVLTAAGIGLLTAVLTVLLAVALREVPDADPTDGRHGGTPAGATPSPAAH